MTLPGSIQFRPIRTDDQDFLLDVYSNTRADVTAAMLDEQEKSDFLRMQFAAQHQFYQATFPRADFLIIMLVETPVGRLYVDRPGDEIHVIDIALLPAHRRSGIGTKIMSEILAEAVKKDLPVRIYVEHYNTALAWYERLGFVKMEDIQTHIRMEWKPNNNQASAVHESEHDT